MTIANLPVLPGLPPPSGDLPLPRQISDVHRVSGARNPRWCVAKLDGKARADVEATLKILDQRLEPAGPEMALAILTPLVNHFRNERSEADWRLLGLDYGEDLAEFSSAHIHYVIRQHRRERTWFPKIAELRRPLEALVRTDTEHRRRARVLLGLEKPHCLDAIADDEADDDLPARDAASITKLLAGVGR